MAEGIANQPSDDCPVPADGEASNLAGASIRPDREGASYRQIFKSTAIVGAAQVANIVIGIARNKALAVLLAPAGFGLAGTYLTVSGMVGGITGLGLGMSGVRQIAEATAGGNQDKLARTVWALRWSSALSGVLGMVILMVLSVPLSHSTFGDGSHAGAIALMSFCLLFGGISTGQNALLQGMRKLADLAKSQVAGAFFGTLASVALVYFLRERGVSLYLVGNAAMTVLFSWWYARKIQLPRLGLRFAELWEESRGLIVLGFAFLLQNLVLGLGAYLSRVVIISDLGLAAVGLYTATWTLSNYYVGMVLKAMGADFYPRLTLVADDNEAMNRLINEQIEMGLLVAIPGVLAILAFAPLALQFLYSGAFVGATEIIRWQILGVVLQVVNWPIAYVQLAKGKGKIFVASEIIGSLVGLLCLLVSLRWWGMEGIGISVAWAGILTTLYYVAVGRWLSGFGFCKQSLRVLVPSLLVVAAGFVLIRVLPRAWGMSVGALLTVGSSIVSVRALQSLLGIDVWQLARRKLGLGNQPGEK